MLDYLNIQRENTIEDFGHTLFYQRVRCSPTPTLRHRASVRLISDMTSTALFNYKQKTPPKPPKSPPKTPGDVIRPRPLNHALRHPASSPTCHPPFDSFGYIYTIYIIIYI